MSSRRPHRPSCFSALSTCLFAGAPVVLAACSGDDASAPDQGQLQDTGGHESNDGSARVDSGVQPSDAAPAPDGPAEVPGWQRLDTAPLGHVNDIAAVTGPHGRAALVATDLGLFRLDASEIVRLIVDRPGGFAAVDAARETGVVAIPADRTGVVISADAQTFRPVTFGQSLPVARVSVGPGGRFGIFGPEAVSQVFAIRALPESGAATVDGLFGWSGGATMTGLAFASAETVYVSDDVEIYHATDTAFEPTSQSGNGGPVVGVDTLVATSTGDVFGGTNDGHLVARDGDAWRMFAGPHDTSLLNGDVADDDRTLLVGARGVVLEHMGNTWGELSLGLETLIADAPDLPDLVDVAVLEDKPLLLTAGGDLLWYGAPSGTPRLDAGPHPDADGGLPSPADAGPPPPQHDPPHLRVMMALDGAVLDACLNGQPYQGPYDRVGNVSGLTSTALSPVNRGEQRLWTEVHFLPDHRCIGLDDHAASFSTRDDTLSLAVLWTVARFGEVEVYSIARPHPGAQAFLRGVGQTEHPRGPLELCVDGQPLGMGAYTAVAPGNVGLTVHRPGEVPCQGEQLTEQRLDVVAGEATAFVVFPSGSSEPHHTLTRCPEIAGDDQIATFDLCDDLVQF